MTVTETLEEALGRLDGADGRVILDFSGVRRIDPSGLRAMEKLAAAADSQGAKVVLCGVRVEVYKVLKLMKLEQRFDFPA